MSEESSEQLRRLFAQAEPVAPDEVFVATVAREVAVRRASQRVRRVGVAVMAVVLAVVLALGLAPYAALVTDSSTMLLMRWPEWLAGTAPAALHAVNPYLYLALLAGVLPLVGTAWLLRRR